LANSWTIGHNNQSADCLALIVLW